MKSLALGLQGLIDSTFLQHGMKNGRSITKPLGHSCEDVLALSRMNGNLYQVSGCSGMAKKALDRFSTENHRALHNMAAIPSRYFATTRVVLRVSLLRDQ